MIIDDLLLCSVCFSAVNIAETLSTVWVAILSAASCGCCSISLAPAWVTPVTASDNVECPVVRREERGESPGHWSDLHHLSHWECHQQSEGAITNTPWLDFLHSFSILIVKLRSGSRSGEGQVIISILVFVNFGNASSLNLWHQRSSENCYIYFKLSTST